METGILNILNFIEDAKKKVSLHDYAKADADFVQSGDIYIGYSPFDGMSHDNYLDRRLIVWNDRYLCLATGESGDILDYIMHRKNLSFTEALEELGHVSGIEVPDMKTEVEDRVKLNAHKERLYALMRDTMLHFFNNLRDPRAKIAVDYLEKRGFEKVITEGADGKVRITNPIVCTFALGFSLDEYALVDAMKAKGYTIEEMDECGLVYLKNGKAYDVMAGRLIIPILNRHGKVIAFSGRIFEAKGHQKYRNTGNTILFSKKNELYGANNLSALSHMGKLNDVFVVEGYMDVISLYKEGVKNAVASMGTALTPDHARILKNYAENVYLTYDGDSAGQDAIRRGVDVCYAEGVVPRVITLPGGQDPDEIIKNHGLQYFLDLKREARDMVTYKIDDLATHYNLDEAEDKGDYSVKAIEILQKYVSTVEADEYLKRISEKSGINVDILTEEMYKSNIKKLQSAKKVETKPLTTVEKGLIFILYDMLENKSKKSLAVFLTSTEENNAYNYMRLMGDGVSEEEFSEILDSDIVRGVTMLKGIESEDLERASRDSYNTLMQMLMNSINDRLFKAFAKETDLETKYILNQCIMNAKKLKLRLGKTTK